MNAIFHGPEAKSLTWAQAWSKTSPSCMRSNKVCSCTKGLTVIRYCWPEKMKVAVIPLVMGFQSWCGRWHLGNTEHHLELIKNQSVTNKIVDFNKNI